MHEGALYEVLTLDLVSRTAAAVPFSGNYYTVPAGEMDTKILQVFEETEFGRMRVHFGDININEMICMFKKLQFHNHQNLGYVQLPEVLQKDYDTESTWMEIPQNVIEVYHSLLLPNAAGEMVLNDHFEGISHAIKNAAMMVTMTAREDIDAVISSGVMLREDSGDAGNERAPKEAASLDNEIMPLNTKSEEGYQSGPAHSQEPNAFGQQAALYIYDRYEGGLGYSEKIYDLVPQIIDNAIRMVSGCACENGCPACVGDYSLDKNMVLWGLKNLKEKSEPPQYGGKYVEKERPIVRKEYAFSKLPEQWAELCENAAQNGEDGAAFLQTVKRVEVSGHCLVLTVENAFYKTWLQESENMQEIESILRRHAQCPTDMKVEVTAEENTEENKKRKEKLQRHYMKI